MRARGVVVAVSFVVLTSGVAYAAYRFYDYTESDPRFCASCHIMQDAWEAWASGEHRDVPCKNCHKQDIVARARIVWSWTTSDIEKVPPHTRLDRRVCENCHLSQETRWKQVGETVGHRQHVGKVDLECLACHLPSLHAAEPKAEDCQRCHSDSKMNIGAMQDFHCTTCHSFLARTEELGAMLPSRETCLQCHRGIQIGSETFHQDGPMAFDCSQCHKPHTKPVLHFSDCLGCHPNIVESQAHSEHRALVDCTSCHRPHSWAAKSWDQVNARE